MNEENFAEKDNFTHEEKISPVKMFCWQVVYLLFNYVPYTIYMQFRQVFISLIDSGWITEHIFPLIFVGFIFIYSTISALSFCVFIWAYMTENLQKHKVRFICNLPFFLMCIYIFAIIMPTGKAGPLEM